MSTEALPEGVRLQKVLAAAGVGSRRVCEDLIAAGRVKVNGEVADELGRRIDPLVDIVHVNGLRVQLDSEHLTIALNKPLGVLSTMSDDFGRPTLLPWVEETGKRLFHVGRLDSDTDGLLLLTNDGELAHRLAHPSYEIAKTYVAEVEGEVSRTLGRHLRDGVELEDGLAKADSFTVLQAGRNSSVVQMVLHEGRNRIVRRMFDAVGHPVIRLTRTSIGPVRLGQLKPGETREISGTDLGELMKVVGL